MTTALEEVEEALAAGPPDVVRPPALVRGRLVIAQAGDPGAYVLRRPLLDPAGSTPTGALQTIVLPAVDPRALIEPDETATRTLMRLPFREVADFVGALRDALADRDEVVRAAAASAGASLPTGARAAALGAELLRGLLDPAGLEEAVHRDLAGPGVPGRRYLDDWVPAGARARSGVAAEVTRRLFALDAPPPPAPRLRALPTRQLHVTAGNSPVIPLVSALRAFATKSPAVVKSSSESFLAATLLAIAMHAVDPQHPITRHTSLVCWAGGDRRIEDVLLAPGRFERLVAWGSEATLASLRARAGAIRTIFLEPRTGASLIGRAALAGGAEEVAARAVADSLADDQQSCSASLVHCVESTPDEALDYCEAVRAALARWDAALPHTPPRDSVGRLRRLRRGQLASERWFTNARDGVVTSSVVCASGPVDASAHPAGRCVVVRPVADLEDALAFLHPGISTVGIAPESRRAELRDAVAARGVSSVVPLGEAERAFAGMPHDGRRILSELVNWATA